MGAGSNVTTTEALTLLKEGNARFVCGKTEEPNRSKKRRQEVAGGQQPFCTVVACSDSRVPVSVLFDRGVGDIFVIRVAGNLCGESEMGSIEYAVEHLHTPLVVILGHSKCGAVTAVVENAEVEGHIASLAEKIVPAVEKARSEHGNLTGEEFLNAAIKENLHYQMEVLLNSSSIVRDAVKAGSTQLMGAWYDIEHGDVTWFGKHPDEKRLVG